MISSEFISNIIKYWVQYGQFYFQMQSTIAGAVEQIAPLIARFVVGAMFAISGHCKLFNPARRQIMYETLVYARVPFPRINTYFVSFCEWVFGFSLLIGLFTPISLAVLGFITLVAVVTVGRHEVKGQDPLWRLSEFLYLPEIFILALIAILFLVGPGNLSIDYLAYQSFSAS